MPEGGPGQRLGVLLHQVGAWGMLPAAMPPASPEPAPLAPRWVAASTHVLGTLAVLGLVLLCARMTAQINQRAAGAVLAAPREMTPCALNGAGHLVGRLYGSVAAEIDWHGAEMRCDGMLRPDGDGIRLVFAAGVSGALELVFVIGIDAGLQGLSGAEHGATVTIIDQGRGAFFSSGGRERCWTKVDRTARIGGPTTLRVAGELYCAGALPAVNGSGSVTLGDFQYSGRLVLTEAGSS